MKQLKPENFEGAEKNTIQSEGVNTGNGGGYDTDIHPPQDRRVDTKKLRVDKGRDTSSTVSARVPKELKRKFIEKLREEGQTPQQAIESFVREYVAEK